MDSQSRFADLHNVRAKLEEQLEQVRPGREVWKEAGGWKWEDVGAGGSRGEVGGWGGWGA